MYIMVEMISSYKLHNCSAFTVIGQLPLIAVRDITWLSGKSVHLAEWMHALEQVTDGHLVKCPQNGPNF